MKKQFKDVQCGDIVQSQGKFMIVEKKSKDSLIGHELGKMCKVWEKTGYEVVNSDFRYTHIQKTLEQ